MLVGGKVFATCNGPNAKIVNNRNKGDEADAQKTKQNQTKKKCRRNGVSNNNNNNRKKQQQQQ